MGRRESCRQCRDENGDRHVSLRDESMPQTITLKLTPEQLAIIGGALGELPHKIVSALVADLQRQINEQTVVPMTAAKTSGVNYSPAKGNTL